MSSKFAMLKSQRRLAYSGQIHGAHRRPASADFQPSLIPVYHASSSTFTYFLDLT